MVLAMTGAPTRQRGSKDIWLNAAYEVLISDGIEGVKIMPLAKRLNLARTGFYWFFTDFAELHSAMIDRWENQNTGTLIARCAKPANSLCEALFNVMDCWLDPTLFDAPLDLAVRNWARLDVDLQGRLADADEQRIQAVTRLFARHGLPNDQAHVRGLTVIYTQIGYISMQVNETRAARIARVRHYVELFAGISPNDQEIAAFLMRH